MSIICSPRFIEFFYLDRRKSVQLFLFQQLVEPNLENARKESAISRSDRRWSSRSAPRNRTVALSLRRMSAPTYASAWTAFKPSLVA